MKILHPFMEVEKGHGGGGCSSAVKKTSDRKSGDRNIGLHQAESLVEALSTLLVGLHMYIEPIFHLQR